MNIKDRVKQYVQLRDFKAAAKKEFDEKMKRVNDALKKLDAEFLEYLNDSESNSVNSDAGTVYKISRTSATVKDRDEFFRFAIKVQYFDHEVELPIGIIDDIFIGNLITIDTERLFPKSHHSLVIMIKSTD